jgi:hypothetical protein
MFKKLFFTAAAAATVSVPLAGAAWATPPDQPNNPPGHPVSTEKPGIPGAAQAFADATTPAPGIPTLNPNPGEPLPPGQIYSNIAKVPGLSTPVAAAIAINNIYGGYSGIPDTDPPSPLPTTYTFVPPGMATKTFTPACESGHTATNVEVNGGASVCH